MLASMLIRCFIAVFLVASAASSGNAASALSYLAPTPTGNTLHDAWSADGSTVYFVGDGGTILTYKDNALELVPSPTQYALFGIHGTSASDIWAVGGDDYAEDVGQRAVVLHYDGQTWKTVIPLSLMGTTYPLDAVYAAGPNDVWGVDDHSPSLFHYNGREWELVYLPFTTYPAFYDIYGFAADDIYAVGGEAQIIHYDGTDWNLEYQGDNPGSSMTTRIFMAVWGPDPQNVYACGNSGQIYKRNAQTGSWDVIRAESGIFGGNGSLNGISGTGPDNMLFTSNGGTLTKLSGTEISMVREDSDLMQNDIIRTAAGEYLIAAGSGRIQKYADGTFSDVNSPVDLEMVTKHAAWADRLWLVPESLDARNPIRAWDGIGHTDYYLPVGQSLAKVLGLVAFAADDIFLGTFYFSDNSFPVFHFDGSEWSSYSFKNSYNNTIIDGLETPSGERWYIVGNYNGGQICKDVDGTWEYLNSSALLSAMTITEDGTIYAVGAAGTVVTVKNGTMTTQASGIDANLVDVAAGNGYVYAVGEDRTAYYTTGSGWKTVAGLNSRDENHFTSVVHAGAGLFYATWNTPSGYIGGSRGHVYRFRNGMAYEDLEGQSSTLHDTVNADGYVLAVGVQGAILGTGFPEPSYSLSGTVTDGSAPVCAMVLANGKYMFSCDGQGTYSLTDIPLDADGKITLYTFCEGFAPYKETFAPETPTQSKDISLSKDAGSPQMDVTTLPGSPNTETGSVNITGSVAYSGTPLCAMVLANGEYAFTCGGGGTFSFTAPLDAEGNITLYTFCEGYAPYKTTLTP